MVSEEWGTKIRGNDWYNSLTISKLEKDKSPQIERMPPVLSRLNENKSTLRHIVMKLQNMEGNIQKALRAARDRTENGLLSGRLPGHFFIIVSRCQKIMED